MGMFSNTEEVINKFIGNDDDTKKDYLVRENSNFVYSLPLLRKNMRPLWRLRAGGRVNIYQNYSAGCIPN